MWEAALSRTFSFSVLPASLDRTSLQHTSCTWRPLTPMPRSWAALTYLPLCLPLLALIHLLCSAFTRLPPACYSTLPLSHLTPACGGSTSGGRWRVAKGKGALWKDGVVADRLPWRAGQAAEGDAGGGRERGRTVAPSPTSLTGGGGGQEAEVPLPHSASSCTHLPCTVCLLCANISLASCTPHLCLFSITSLSSGMWEEVNYIHI